MQVEVIQTVIMAISGLISTILLLFYAQRFEKRAEKLDPFLESIDTAEANLLLQTVNNTLIDVQDPDSRSSMMKEFASEVAHAMRYSMMGKASGNARLEKAAEERVTRGVMQFVEKTNPAIDFFLDMSGLKDWMGDDSDRWGAGIRALLDLVGSNPQLMQIFNKGGSMNVDEEALRNAVQWPKKQEW